MYDQILLNLKDSMYFNKGGSGVNIGRGSLKIHSSVSIEFLNKLNVGTLFYAEIRRQMTVGSFEGDKVTIVFKNNEVQFGGIFVLETYVMYIPESVTNNTSTEINLENNTIALMIPITTIP